MGMRAIDHAAALSEFQGYNGDCGETAELAALHVVDPAKWPLDAATLNAIVKRDIGKGWAAANGAEPLSSVASDLTLAGIAYSNHGYGEPLGYSWRGILDAQGGIRPVVLEVAVAGNLPGNQAGVHYHFITCLGWDPTAGVGLFANGDGAEARGGSLARYTAADLTAAQVCGALEVTTPVTGWHMAPASGSGASSGVPQGWTDDGTTLTAPNGIAVVSGFREWVLGHSWDAKDEPQAAESGADPVEVSDPASGAGTLQPFSVTGQLCWTQARGVFVAYAGVEILALRAALAAAMKNAATPAEVAALAAVRQVAADIAAALAAG